MKKVLKQYIILTGIYLPLIIWGYAQSSRSLIDHVKRFILDLVFTGSYYHLWYFIALIWGVLLLGLFAHKVSHVWKKMIILAILGFLFVLIGDSYYHLFDNHMKVLHILVSVYEKYFGSTRNSVGFSFPFLVIGFLVQRYKLYKKQSCNLFFALFIGSLILYIIEICCLLCFSIGKDYNASLFLVPTAGFLFCFIAALPCSTKKSIWFRKMSTYLFFLHPIPLFFVSMITENMMFRFIVTLLVTIVLSAILSWKKMKETILS